MSAGKPVPLVIYGWTVFAHPLFLAQIEALAQQVEEDFALCEVVCTSKINVQNIVRDGLNLLRSEVG